MHVSVVIYTMDNGLKVTNNIKLRKTLYAVVWVHTQGVTGGTDQISGECSLGQTIPI